MKTTPNPHQTEAADAATSGLKRADRATIVMPCGTGKTLVGCMITEALAPKALVLFFPSLALIKQTLQAWKNENPLGEMDYLCVCSDQTIDEDEAHITLEEFGEGNRVTTDPVRVRAFLKNRSTPKIIFSTYQSALMIQADEPIDLAIMDEAHRTAGAHGNAYSVPLDDSHIPIKKRVFMTATPRHVASDDADKTAFSMLDETVYGKIVYAMSISDAIERGIICDYKIIVSVTTDADIAEIAAKHDTSRVEASTIAAAVAIRSAMDAHGVKKAITFHNTVLSASRFAADPQVMEIVGAGMFGHVNGKQSSAKRDAVMNQFRAAPTGLVSNARCLTEGVDVPSVDMVAFLSRKDSIIDVVQACGRAMRLAEGKTEGHILLPLHVNVKLGETVEQAVMRSGFREVWRVIGAMREQDMIVAGSGGRLVSRKSLQKANQTAERRIEVIGASSSEMIDEIRETVRAVSVKRLSSRSWEDSFALLLEAREKHDTWDFAKADPELAFLDVWIETQKKSHRNKTLRPELEARLRAIGFPFNQKQTDSWEESFQHYVNGTEPEGRYSINRWVAYQRAAYKGGRLAADRIEKLKGAGFEFDGLKAREAEPAAREGSRRNGGGSNVPAQSPVSEDIIRCLDQLTRFQWAEAGEAMIAPIIEFVRKNLLVCGEKAVVADDESGEMAGAIRHLFNAEKKGLMTEDQIKLANDAGLFFEYRNLLGKSFGVGDVVEAGTYKNRIVTRLLSGPSIIPRVGYPLKPERYLEYALWMRLVANKGLTEIEARIRDEIIDAAGDISNPKVRMFMSKDEMDSVFASRGHKKDAAADMATLDKILSIESALD